uniref:Rho GTPase activating protein 10 n=1 Tax=Anabas testudineus TaxID=64144 RepID=A0AAQ6IDA8_ANATE
MGLHPLEFSECYLDSPGFRDKIKAHEAELDKTNRFIKELYKDGKNLINATKQLVMAQRKFAHSLGEFQFEYIGDAKTDDERCIDESLQEFSSFLKNLEDQRELMMRNITETLMKPLETFRKDQLGIAERKKYEKETEKYYSSLEKLLNMSAKKKDTQLQEANSQVESIRKHFQEESLDYVCKLQEIQERKKFECVEPMLAFFQTVFTFYHQGYELAKDFDHYKKALQINIQNTRNCFEGTRSEVYELKKRFQEAPQEYRQTSPISYEGYLYVQEKRPPPFGSSWVKRYCTFVKEQKILHMVTFDHRSGGKIGETESITLKSCVRKSTDILDRRFCLDLDITDRPGTVLTVQALSEDDHKFWMQAMGGKEPVSQLPLICSHLPLTHGTSINDQGLYRVGGVSSKVQKLLSLMIVHSCFSIHHLVHKLPERNRQVLGLLMKHLAKVAAHSKQNLMTVANLGVVFGPTLMRPQEETVAAIMDLKFQNIVVEILIEQDEKIFADAPESSPISPATPVLSAPARQSKRLSRQNRPLAVYNPQSLDIQNGKRYTCVHLCNAPVYNFTLLKMLKELRLTQVNEQAGPGPRLNCAVILPKAPVTGRKAMAVYPCEAEHDSELSFQVGAIFHAVVQSREPGWLEGELEGKRGLIPENYVEML